MKLEKSFIAILVAAIALAIPVSSALSHRTHQLKIERSQKQHLQIQVDSVQRQLEKKDLEIKAEQQKQQQLQNENGDLKTQLQSKRSAQATVASAGATSPSVVYGGGGNCESYRGLVSQYSWNVNIALAVMQAESGCNPTASSPTCDHGLMQVNCVHRAAVGGDLSLLNDPATNIRVAYGVYAGAAGWSPWTTFTSGAYRRYLK